MADDWNGRRVTEARDLVLGESTLCHLCGRGGADTLDHYYSRRDYPELTWEPSNWRPAHSSCNLARGAMPIEQWFTLHPITIRPEPSPLVAW